MLLFHIIIIAYLLNIFYFSHISSFFRFFSEKNSFIFLLHALTLMFPGESEMNDKETWVTNMLSVVCFCVEGLTVTVSSAIPHYNVHVCGIYHSDNNKNVSISQDNGKLVLREEKFYSVLFYSWYCSRLQMWLNFIKLFTMFPRNARNFNVSFYCYLPGNVYRNLKRWISGSSSMVTRNTKLLWHNTNQTDYRGGIQPCQVGYFNTVLLPPQAILKISGFQYLVSA